MEDQLTCITIWQQIETLVPPQERDSLKRIVGAERIDDNEDLFQELSLLKDILSSFSKETEKSASLVCRRQDARRETQCDVIRHLYGRLQKKKIKFEAQLRDKQILDYVAEPVPSRPSTARSLHSARRRPSTTSSDTCSTVSSFDLNSMDIEYMKPHLNIFNIDKIVKEVQQSLRDERAILEGDIDFVRSCIENEETYRQKTTTFQQPSLSELMHLEQQFVDLLEDTTRHGTPVNDDDDDEEEKKEDDDGLALFRDPDAFMAKQHDAKKRRQPLHLKPKNKFFTPTKRSKASSLLSSSSSSSCSSSSTVSSTSKKSTKAPRLRRRIPSSKSNKSKSDSTSSQLSSFLQGTPSVASSSSSSKPIRKRPTSAARFRSRVLSTRSQS